MPYRLHKYYPISLTSSITPNLFDEMPQTILILLPILTLFFHSSSALVATDSYYHNCSRPYRCSGTNINVTFPFSLPDSGSPSNCSFPGYELHCSDVTSELSLKFDGVDYRVKDINYTQGIITLVDSDFLGDSCPHTFTNTRINFTLFDFADLDFNLTVYVNCTFPLPGLTEILCSNGLFGPQSYYMLEKGPPAFMMSLLGGCQMEATVPVYATAARSLNSSSAKFGEALQQGFGLKWTAGKEWCKGCIDSGGNCGYNSTKPTDPTCFCPNNTALGACPYERRRSKKKPWWVFIVASVAFGLLLVLILLCALMIKRQKHKNVEQSSSTMNWDYKIMHELNVGEEGSPEISFFKFSHIVSATDNFSDINKLGQGGFGPVYKGRLAAGQEVAIKRLSARSGQGLEEFKNEILLIAKLRHRNLVRLLGCCIYGEEKILVYEFMPNKSLDIFLFNVEQKSKLDWATRFQIIEGIAHGLFYLHKHSILRIIHRDLKASNILLDAEMNPKISDFGLARIFYSNDTEVNTRRIVGTFGYMSPEYVSEGRFSIKSDVFSFGVLLLEIVSGKRNHSFHEYDYGCNLLGYAWDLWKKGNWMEIVDPSLDNNFQIDQMVRCIYVALLCVQERPEDRPGISDVIVMLGNENLNFNIIKQPAFFTMKNTSDSEWPLNQHVNTSSNGLTISTVKAR